MTSEVESFATTVTAPSESKEKMSTSLENGEDNKNGASAPSPSGIQIEGDKWKASLLRNYEVLVTNTNLEKTLDELVSDDVFSSEEREIVESVEPDTIDDKNRKILDLLLRKSERHLTKFLSCLEDIGHSDIVLQIKGTEPNIIVGKTTDLEILKKQIKKNYRWIIQNTALENYVDGLYEEDHFDDNDRELVDNEPTTQAKNRRFLQLLFKKNLKALITFLDELKADGQEDLVRKIEETAIETDETSQDIPSKDIKEKLLRNYKQIVHGTDLSQNLDRLLSADIISAEEKDCVQNVKPNTSNEKNRELLKIILIKKSDTKIGQFFKCLADHHLAETILQTDVRKSPVYASQDEVSLDLKRKMFKNYKEVVEKVSLSDFLDIFISERLIDITHIEDITNTRSSKDRDRAFMDELLKGEHGGFSLLKIVMKKDHAGLVQTVTETNVDQSVDAKIVSHNSRTDPVTENIRSQTKRIERWIEEDKDFVETHATENVSNSILEKDFVAVSGAPGSGKSATIHHIALQWRKYGYHIVPVYSAEEIERFWSPKAKQVFLLDDPFGVHSLDEVEISSWNKRNDNLKTCLTDNKILVSVRKQIVNDKRVTDILKQFDHKIVDICSEDLKLSEEEKSTIFQRYMQSNQKTVDGMDSISVSCELSCFPLLCRIFSSNSESLQGEVKSFFERPISILQKEILRLRDNDKIKYFCLVLCLVYDNELNESILGIGDKDKNCKTKRKTFLDLCGLSRSTSVTDIRKNLDSLVGTYMIKEGHNYKFLHDVIFDTVVSSLPEDFHEYVLEHCSSRFLSQRVTFPEMIGTEHDEDIPPYILLNENLYKQWGNRLVKDMKENKISDVLFNECFKLQKCDAILASSLQNNPDCLDIVTLMTKKISQNVMKHERNRARTSTYWIILADLLTNLSFRYMMYGDLTPLHVLAAKGMRDTFSIFWKTCDSTTKADLLSSGTLLCSAARGGNEKITELLTSTGADVNKCDEFLITPLIYAAGHGHGIMAADLMNGGANVNTPNRQKLTPLSYASLGGHGEVVQMLIERGADVNHCDMAMLTPLIYASKGGHDKVVKILIEKDAKVDQCDNYKSTALIYAAKGGHDKVVQELIENGAGVNKCDSHQFTPLLYASKEGHDNVVHLLIEKGGSVNECDRCNSTPLLHAAKAGHEKVVQILIAKGADVNHCDKDQSTPLLHATFGGYDKIVQMLIEKGADINKLKSQRNEANPLLHASEKGHDKVVQILIEEGADVNQLDENQNSPLLIASKEGHIKVVQILIEKGADMNHRNIYELTPLFYTCQGGHGKVVKLLVEKGADFNLCYANQYTALSCASEKGHEKVVQTLIEKGADVNGAAINKYDKDLSTPLLYASKRGHDKVVQILIEKGADIRKSDRDQFTPLLYASKGGHAKVVQLLIQKGADVNQCDLNKCTPLHHSSNEGHDKVVQLLIEKGADVNQCDRNQSTPIFYASKQGHDKVVQVLIQKGASVNQNDKHQSTPLIYASKQGKDKVVKTLIEKGANINQCDYDQISPLLCAASKGHGKVVQLLLEKGAEVNHCDKYHSTPLLSASEKGHANTVEILIKKGASVNQCDEYERTALLYASQEGHCKVVQMLIENGAVVNQCDKDESSPLLYASKEGHDKVVQILIENGANVNQCDVFQTTPLFYATYKGHQKVVQILKEKSENTN